MDNQEKRHTIYVDDELWETAQKKAQEMGVSLSFVIRFLLKLFVADKVKIFDK